eukprot:CAMPEP_0194260588 /NCGR_PEP_ID=MMETSP0158-20130606/45588_1 /TAXON_ID=33649 /ORGANISM="Thalassionema nitzschioides, Strain L26-B" /LENGTH=414 /DNA_ID=CAMNT_0039000683 /DNA_START=133 /DNA_END=1377 /DNA_ORIENTATION=-
MAFNEDSSASGHDEPWIQWFCGLKGHEMFCEVERSYIEDGFNLYGLRTCVQNFSDCLDLILDRIGPDDSDDSHLTQNACTLYGLIHARYIITAHGLDAMYNKYAAKEFGTCPLIPCRGQPVLPAGLRDDLGADTAKIFCPKCQNVYHPPPVRSRSTHGSSGTGGSGGVDGACLGTTFPHLFLMTFSNTLYGLIHARYIITAHGLDAMYNKYAAKEFGTCPLIPCVGQPVLPVGLRDDLGADTVKIFCPKCQNVYHPPPVRSRSTHGSSASSGVDGASFGTTFPHLFLMTFSNLVPDPLPPNSTFVPRVFGFRVHQSAKQSPKPASSPIQMIVARRVEKVEKANGKEEGENKSKNSDKKDAAEKLMQSTSKKVNRPSSSGIEEKKRTADQNLKDGDENGVVESATKRRKGPEKDS